MRAARTAPLLTLLLPLAAGCPAPGEPGASGGPERSALSVKGSDTMVHLVTAWAEAFAAARPAAEVSVTGGGSGVGIAGLLNGTAEVCMASRELSARELELARQRGLEPVDHVVGRDGIAVVVHPDNPIDSLTLEQVHQLFNGTLTSWSQVGGPDRPVQLLSRESSSGTYHYFMEHVLRRDDFAPHARLMPSTSAIVQATAQDAWSIGYVGLGYLEGAAVKPLALRATADAPAVAPSVAAVQDGSYPLSRPLHLYTAGAPTGLALEFIEFALSPAGQELVATTGYVPVGARTTK